MVTVDEIKIFCDECPSVFYGEATPLAFDLSWSAEDAVIDAVANGWTVDEDGEARCPNCIRRTA